MRYASILIYDDDSPPPLSDFGQIGLVVQLHDDGSGHVIRDAFSPMSERGLVSAGTLATLFAECLGTGVKVAETRRLEQLQRASQLVQILLRALKDAWWLDAAAAYAELSQMFPEQTLDPLNPQD